MINRKMMRMDAGVVRKTHREIVLKRGTEVKFGMLLGRLANRTMSKYAGAQPAPNIQQSQQKLVLFWKIECANGRPREGMLNKPDNAREKQSTE